MIRHPERIWALVAAIDRYDDSRIPELASPVHDALAILRWLAALEVPWENLMLHVASKSPRRGDLDVDAAILGTRFVRGLEREEGAVRLLDAKRRSIIESVAEMLRLPAGSDNQLLVFLLGHGFQIPNRGELTSRVFLTEDYSPIITENIGIGYLADTFRYGAGVRQVIIVFDACSLQPFLDDERAGITPGQLTIQLRSLNTAVGVAVCSASGQLELARENLVAGDSPGSVFLAELLDVSHPDHIEDDLIDFDGDQPVVDLRMVMENEVMPRVQAETNRAQNPELIPDGANARGGVIPLYFLDREMNKERFLQERRVRAASREGRSWVDKALDYREHLTRGRRLHYSAYRFREAISLIRRVPPGHVERPSLVAALEIMERDLRVMAMNQMRHSQEWAIPVDVTDELRLGPRTIQIAMETADRAWAASDPFTALTHAGESYVAGALDLRIALEATYAKAVWEALRQIAARGDGLRAEDAVRLLGQWAAVADSPQLSQKADGIAARVGTGDGSLGLMLLKHHAHLEQMQSWIRENVDPSFPRMSTDLIAHLATVRLDLAEAVLGDGGPQLQQAIRRLLETYRMVSDALDQTILDALNRRAGSWSRRFAT